MIPNIFAILDDESTAQALLGDPVRVYPWGEAPQNVLFPYVTYGVYNGLPENYLGNIPDIDQDGTQIDIWAKDSASCRAVFIAIRDIIEPQAHMTSYQLFDRDTETQLYHGRMDFDFWGER